MTSERPHRKALQKMRLLLKFIKMQEHKFDPNITRIAIEKIFNFSVIIEECRITYTREFLK